MNKQIIATDQAPAAVGPYEQAIVYNGVLYASGQIPLNLAGEMVAGDVSVQARQCLTNLRGVCQAAGTSLDNGLKITMFLTDMNDFAAVNAVYLEFFTGAKAARSTIAVKALPKGALVEIEGIFAVPTV